MNIDAVIDILESLKPQNAAVHSSDFELGERYGREAALDDALEIIHDQLAEEMKAKIGELDEI